MSQAVDRSIPAIVSSKLAGLRLKMGIWLSIEALSRILPTLLGLLSFVFVVDYLLEMDVPQRVIMSILSGLVLVIVFFFKVIKPFMRRPSDDALCLEVEKQNAGLRDSLISAVQFSRGIDSQRQGVSPEMVAATIEQGSDSAANINFATALNEKRYLANVVISLISAVCMGIFIYGMLNNQTMNVFMNRLFFYGEAEYAKNTYLDFYDPEDRIKKDTLTIYRGQDCKLLVHIREESLIKDVNLRMSYRDSSSGYWVTDDMRQTNRFGGREFEIVYKSVAADFEVQARGGDGRTKKLKVELEDPPQFSNLVAEVTYPDYTVDIRPGDLVRVFDRDMVYRLIDSNVREDQSWEPVADLTENGLKLIEWNLIDESQLQTVRDEQLNQPNKTYVQIAQSLDMFSELDYSKVLGDQLEVKTVRTEVQRLSLSSPSDRIENFGGKLTILDGSSIRLFAKSNRDLAVAELVHNQGVIPFSATDDGSQFELSIAADEVRNGQFKIRLRDESMRVPPRSAGFEIEIEADQTPEVRASLKGISGLVINRAKIPFTVTVNDDFKIEKVFLRYSWQDDTGEQTGSGEVAFEEYEPMSNWQAGKPDEPMKVSEILPSSGISLTQQFLDLDALVDDVKIPAGAGLNFTIVAVDNDLVGEANTGVSKEFLLRVVTEEEFRADLLRREKEARQEFDLIYGRQKETQTDTEALAADTKIADESYDQFYSEIKKQLSEYTRNQRLIGENIEGVIGRMEDLLTEGMNNRLDESTGEFETRYSTRIIGPMQTITDEMMIELRIQLDSARRAVTEESKRLEHLSNAAVIQGEIIKKMEDILQEMEKNEGLQEIINKVFEAKKSQAKLKKQTDDERKKRIQAAKSAKENESGEGER